MFRRAAFTSAPPSPRVTTPARISPLASDSSQPWFDPRDDSDPVAPPPHLRQAAYEKIGETYDLRQACLADMRARIETHPDSLTPHVVHGQENVHFVGKDDDTFLVAFIRCKKLRSELAWVEYLSYCVSYTNDGLLSGVDKALVRRYLNSNCFRILTSRDPESRVIIAISCPPFIPIVEDLVKQHGKHEGMQQILRAIFFLFNLVAFRSIDAQIYGAILVGDLRGCKLRIMSYLNFHQYQNCLHICQWAMPLRATAFYCMEEPFYVRAVITALRPFMKEKVRAGFLCCGTGDKALAMLHTVIPAVSLPSAFGGTLPDTNAEFDILLTDVDTFPSVHS
jgi:hypothetical protein